jgi:hypothetical protein
VFSDLNLTDKQLDELLIELTIKSHKNPHDSQIEGELRWVTKALIERDGSVRRLSGAF